MYSVIGVLLNAFLLHGSCFAQQYVTTEKWPGRFGDQIILQLKAHYVAREFRLPYLFKPFDYSQFLKVHFTEELFDPTAAPKRRITLNRFELPKVSGSAVFKVGFYFPLPSWQKLLEDTEFMVDMKKKFSPAKRFAIFHDTESIKVAVHVRKGGGFDPGLISKQLYTNTIQTYHVQDNYACYEIPLSTNLQAHAADERWPLKFMPDQYYIDQINYIAKKFKKNKIHVHIFTDDQNPINIVRRYRQELKNSRITFSCRIDNNSHDANVIEDFFSMAYDYDCLIRCGSTYAFAADIIGNHKLVIWPSTYTWVNNALMAHDVHVTIKDTSMLFLKYTDLTEDED